MDKILKDMMQQRKLQAAEREARRLAGNKSPRTPASPGRARIGSPAGSPRTPNRQSPVRIGAAPSDQITTTPVRPPSDTFTTVHPTKLDTQTNLNAPGNSKTIDNGLNNSSTVQKSQAQQPTPSVSTVSSVTVETPPKTSGEATPPVTQGPVTTQGSVPSQTVQREVTSTPQTSNQNQEVTQTVKTSETKVENTEIKSEAPKPTEQMDTS